MQIDSHLRFDKDWDTKSIKMLHNCDAGEYSVLTTYGNGFSIGNGFAIGNGFGIEELSDRPIIFPDS